MTPTARSLSHLRKLGYQADVVERWIPKVNIRRDLFFAWDILGLKVGQPLLAVQVTTGANASARVEKVAEQAVFWKSTGNVCEVWAWSKQGPRGQRKVWKLRRIPL